MSDWTIVNLHEIEDSAAGRLEGVEARMGRNHLGSRDLGVTLFRYAPNLRNPMSHSHRDQEEAYVGLELIAVGGPKPEGGDGVLSERPWPDAAAT
jgi:hypothetical protein